MIFYLNTLKILKILNIQLISMVIEKKLIKILEEDHHNNMDEYATLKPLVHEKGFNIKKNRAINTICNCP
jgi:hypothetical protein